MEESALVLQLQEEITYSNKANTELNAKFKAAEAELEKTKKLMAKEKSEADAKELVLKAVSQQLEALKKIEVESNASLELKSKELAELQAAVAKAKQDEDKTAANTAASAAQLDDLNNKLLELQAQLLEKAESASRLQEQVNKADSDLVTAKNKTDAIQAQHDEVDQENELLLTQLMEVQEELEMYYLDKVKFENLYQEMQVRWDRLEKRYPNYVDFGSIELVAFDNISDTPSITWRVKDFAQGGVALDEFVFHTILRDGQPGIGLVLDSKEPASLDSVLVPKLVKPQSKEFERFVRMGQSDFRQIMVSAAIIAQLEASSWHGVKLPQDFDLGFWRQSLKLLPAQLQALPTLLRYDAVKLKRELINPDYEHLWLEIKGMGLGGRTWPKFEIRLGAAMVEHNGFSQFPKFEIPLIDGKTKPFDSWYAESQDDSGAKLELRFSLEKQVFDTSVWSRLDGQDKVLFLRLIYSMPDVLLRLESEHVAIYRPWTSWIDLAKSAMQVIEVNRMAAQSKDLPAPESKPITKEAADVTTILVPPQDKKKTNLEKAVAKKTLATKKVIKPDSKLSATAKKSVATNSKKLDKNTSDAKQTLPSKRAAMSKKTQSTNQSTKSVAKKIGRKK